MASVKILVHSLTDEPNKAWNSLSQTQTVIPLTMQPPNSPIAPDKVRFVCMSDTHSLTKHLPFKIPPGDVLLHAGDFTRIGHADEVQQFNSFLGALPHKHKIVIAGNHELSFDPQMNEEPVRTINQGQAVSGKGIMARDLITNAVYLEDSATSVYGIKIYGTPWQPFYCNWAFNLPRGQPCLDKWNLIPDDVDILLTHTPPIGHGDLCASGVHAGCVELLATIQNRVKPKFHVFGHIHEGYGTTSDGQTVFLNASTCTVHYKPTNEPICFDFPLPDGRTKDEDK